jgi:hypothetical protein
MLEMWQTLLLKSALSADKLPVPDTWQVAKGKRDGKPMIVRAHAGYRPFKGVIGYEDQLGIAAPLHTPDAAGLPTPFESGELDALENDLCKIFEADMASLLVAVITCNGMREFILYTKDPALAREQFEELKFRSFSHKIHMRLQPDKDWRLYTELF